MKGREFLIAKNASIGGSFISSTNNTNYDMLQQTDTSSSNQPNQYFGKYQVWV